jgi:hypothetical protein
MISPNEYLPCNAMDFPRYKSRRSRHLANGTKSAVARSQPCCGNIHKLGHWFAANQESSRMHTTTESANDDKKIVNDKTNLQFKKSSSPTNQLLQT